MKTCNVCGETKPLEEFYKTGNNKHRAGCILCYKETASKKGYYNPNSRTFEILDKKEKAPFEFESLEELAQLQLNHIKVVESKQRTAHIRPAALGVWIGVAVFGDLHFGDWYQDLKTLMKHTELVLEAENVIAIQVGDILSNQASFTHRGKNREAPREFPLSLQKKAAQQWFKKIGEKMAAFIIGNHDIRSLYSEGYDVGEIVVDEIKGAYLGAKGDLFIEFDEELIYQIRIVHGDRTGYSMWNPNHPGARVQAKVPHVDIVVHGHIHSDVAYQGVPTYDGNRAAYVRSAGYTRDVMLDDAIGIPASHYAWKVGEGCAGSRTPIILLNPLSKEVIIHENLELGLALLRFLNSDQYPQYIEEITNVP